MKTFLVTGGCGFIGSAVCRRLIAAGHQVVNLDKLTYAATLGSTAAIANSPLYTFAHADIADAVAVARLFSDHQPDAVVHLAAESHVDRSIDGPRIFVETNIVGTFTLLEAAREYWSRLPPAKAELFRFLHVSTDEVYGSLGPSGLFDEHSPYCPRSPYSATKAGSDHLVAAWGHTFGLPVLMSHCSNNYGPFHFPEKLIPLTIVNAIEGRPIGVYGDGANIRDWLYVEDHAAALHLIVERGAPGETYNVGSRNERTNLQLVHTVCDLIDELMPRQGRRSTDLITFVPDRPGHDARYGIDPTKLETALGWRADVGLEDGLRMTVEWFIANEGWWRPLRTSYSGERVGVLQAAKEA